MPLRIPPQKSLDKGGEGAWQGGVAAIEAADIKVCIYCFVLRRLQSLVRLTGAEDPSNVVKMNFESILQTVETMAEKGQN